MSQKIDKTTKAWHKSQHDKMKAMADFLRIPVSEERRMRQLKRENAQYLRWLKVLVNPMSIATRIETWTEIRAKLPDLFKTKRRGSE